jgi:hypothetical protein
MQLESCSNPEVFAADANCAPVLMKWCKNEANISDRYCTQYADIYNKAMREYCTPENILSKKMCKEWVLDPHQQGSIDLVMQQYCQQNPGDGLCCYMQSKIPCPNKFDSRCFGTAAYQTLPMTSVTCPDVLNCNQYISLDPSSKAFASNIEANCGGQKKILSSAPRSSYVVPVIGVAAVGAAAYFLIN